MKFLYLIKRPLVQRDWDRFGIGFMLDRGHSVTVLDLSEVIHPYLDNDRAGAVRDDRVDIREIASWTQFEGQRQVFLDCDLVIFLIQSHGLSRFIYRPLRMIARTGIPYLILAPVVFPGWGGKVKLSLRVGMIADIWTRLCKMDMLDSLISRLPISWLGIRAASYIVYSSSAGEGSNTLVGPLTKTIMAHTIDYEIYLDELKRDPKLSDRAVFLDQFMPYHIDYQELNAGHIDDREYFGCLCRLFERIEKELGLEVVIAAHPRANYDNRPGLFGDRKVIYGQTAHLVATSRLVMAHQSTAIGFAVLFEKPVMILVTPALYSRSIYDKYYYEGFASELGTSIHFFDDPESIDMSDVCTFNHKLYDRYKKTYMKCANSPQKPFWEIVMDNINRRTKLTNE